MVTPLNRGRSIGTSRYRPMSEINVTPMVDVMLVLLIVFMVTAPLLTVGVAVDLPQSKASPLGEQRQPLSVSIDASGQVYLQDQKIELGRLIEQLRAIAEVSKDTRIYVRGDKSIAYGIIMEVMGTINAAGFNRVALVTEPLKRLRGRAEE
ncbi:MAG: protein TolR [Alphaproteobacteria bacterium]|nr:MAG: protein TolR [Alphaproteobacteria bacterium]